VLRRTDGCQCALLRSTVHRETPARHAWWLAAVTAVLIIWFVLVRRADRVTGFALTGVVACLISPVTWVHHLVWLWWSGTPGWLAAIGGNTYVWISLGLLAAVPAARSVSYAPAGRT
jgi:hypothetical protein